MLSAVIRNGHSYRTMPLARQFVHHRSAHPGPLVLGATPLNSPARTLDRDRLFVTRPADFLFSLAPCVAAGIRPYLLALSRVRRMACEDSDRSAIGLSCRLSAPRAFSLLIAVAEASRSSQHLARFVLGIVVAELSLLTG